MNRHTLLHRSWLIAVYLAALVAVPGAQADPVAEIERFDGTGDWRPFQQMLVELAPEVKTNAAGVEARLMKIVDDPGREWQVRAGAWQVWCDAADAQHVAASAGPRLLAWRRAIEWVNGDWQAAHVERELCAETMLAAIRRPDLRSPLFATEGFREALTYAIAGGHWRRLKQEEVDSLKAILASAPLSAREKSHIAESVIFQRTQTLWPQPALAVLLDAESLATLRDHAAKALASGDKMPWHDLATLAHLADPDAGRLIALARSRITSSADDPRVRVRELDETDRLEWMVAVQASPTGLFAAISEPIPPVDVDGVARRGWAMNRALQVGATRETVRAALETSRAAMEQARSAPGADRKTQLRLGGKIAGLKHEGIHSGVLTDADWPEIKLGPPMRE